ncbi:MAG: hypothetical protein WBK76_03515 [Candidatus Saccharimonadales bacterium]
MTDGLMLVFLVVIVLVGGGILFLIAHGRGAGKQLDVDRYRTSWMTIERQLVKGEETTSHLAVLNADKLLDQALRQRGVKGDTMGERMKNAAGIWSNANTVWSAHKIRNRIAHEPDVRVGYDNARRALAAYKRALKDLGAI